MRTLRDDLISDIIQILSNAYGDGGLTETQEYYENLHNAEEIAKKLWDHVEPFAIDSNGNMILDYGMIRATLVGIEEN